MIAKSKLLVVILLSVALILAGCNGTALPVKEAMLNSLDQESVEFAGKFSLKLNLPENMVPQEEEAKQLVSYLENGIRITGKQANKQQLQLEITPLAEQQPVSYEIIMDNENIYATSSDDKYYVKYDLLQQQGFEQEKFAQYQQQSVVMLKDFYRKYIEDFGYTLTNATNHGTKTLTLPNGDTVKAKHIQITLDEEEIYQLLLYVLNNATSNENVRQFLSDYVELVMTLSPEDEEITEEEKKEAKKIATQFFFMGLEYLNAELESMTASEAMAKLGITDINMDLHYYITDRRIVKDEFSFGINWADAQSSQTAGIQFNSEFFAWNHNKEMSLELPDNSQVITYSSLQKNRDNLNNFHKDSLLYKLLYESLLETVVLTFDIDDGFAKYNDTLVDGVTAYITNGNTMVPFRYLGESMGADISWIADSRTAVFQLHGTEIRLQAGSKTAWVNGKQVMLNVAPEIKNGKLYVPLRFVSENLNAHVEWDAETKQAIISFTK